MITPSLGDSSTAQTPRLRALVLEDELPARDFLVELIEATRLGEVVGAVARTEEAREILHPATGLPVDVVFVDVHLAADTEADAGLALVRSMAGRPGAPTFVLATVFSQHAIEAFDLGVVDYLLKPFNQERVEQSLRRVLKHRSVQPLAPATARVVARRKRSLVFLELAEIWAFEAADRQAFVHSRQGKFDIDLSLAAIETSFGRTFTRVHRNWLINLRFVKELERDSGDTTLFLGSDVGDGAHGIRVPVSRDRAQSVREMLLTNATGLRHSQGG